MAIWNVWLRKILTHKYLAQYLDGSTYLPESQGMRPQAVYEVFIPIKCNQCNFLWGNYLPILKRSLTYLYLEFA